MKDDQQPGPKPFDSGTLRAFLAVVEAGGMVGAAKTLDRTPSAVSMQIKKLEGQLGTALFERAARRLTLTGTGEKLLTYFRQLVCLNNEAVAALTEPHLRRSVRVGLPGDINERILPPIIRHLASAHPGIAINVVTAPTDRLVRLFEDRELELLLTICDGRSVPAGEETIGKERLVWARARDGQAYRKTPLPVAMSSDETPCWEAALKNLQQHERQFRIACTSASACVRQAAVMADLAVAPILSSCLTGDLVELGVDDGFESLPDLDIRLRISEEADEAIVIVSNAIREFYLRFARDMAKKSAGVLPR